MATKIVLESCPAGCGRRKALASVVCYLCWTGIPEELKRNHRRAAADARRTADPVRRQKLIDATQAIISHAYSSRIEQT